VPKSQLKLTAALAALVLLVVAVWGAAAERGLRRAETERLSRSLEERAALVNALVSGIPFEVSRRAELDAIADRAGAAAGARVTLIGPDGSVLGDSEVPPERLPDLENHATRPEVARAMRGATGRSTRPSVTVGRDLMYLALPAAGGGVVRVASDLSTLDDAVASLRWELAAAGGVGIATALALSFAFSWLTLRPIREMRRVASSIAEGHLDDRLPFRSGDELADISTAINQMAEQLRLRLEEVTHDKEQLHAVLEAMVEGVLAVDSKRIILLANSRVREFYGVSGEIVGRPFLEAIRDADLDELLGEAARTDEIVSRALTVRYPASRILRVQAVRFPATGGPRVGTVVAFHDITELMRLEEVRRDFVANASHELRTPLAAIRGFAETLLRSEGLSESERRSYLEVIDRHAQRLANIVRDLLELSTIESRTVRLDLAPLDLEQLAAGLVRDWEPRLSERRLSLRQRSAGDVVAWADRRAVEQILTNLLDNAIKYTEPGGEIEIAVEGLADCVRVSVCDSGIGIPQRDLGRIFERFYRVDKARSRALGGTGLGLSIVKHLVQSLGGRISVESQLGVGSTFHFDVPRPPRAVEDAAS
jgi:two-component system, OmpR family, phosphate regulon sensor histidine kinase PhoR